MKHKPCKYCGGTDHTSLMCFNKPRVPDARLKNRQLQYRIGKEDAEDVAFRSGWKQSIANHTGMYPCYLKISPLCPGWLTMDQVTLEHKNPKSRFPEQRRDRKNAGIACEPCNKLKGTRTLEELQRIYPHLRPHHAATNFE